MFPVDISAYDDSEKGYRISVGHVFEIDNQRLILTCHHSVKNSSEICVYFYITVGNKIVQRKEKATIVSYAPDLDLALLKPNRIPKEYTGQTISNLYTKLLKKRSEIIFSYIKKKTKTHLTVDIKSQKCIISDIYVGSFMSLNDPAVPVYHIDIKTVSKLQDKIEGMSGSLISYLNNTAGILSNYDKGTKQLVFVPAYCIFKFLSEFKKFSKYHGMCNIVGKFTGCQITDDNQKITNGLMIDTTFGIDYTNYDTNKDLSYTPLKTADIIVSVNDKNFNEDSTVYDANLDYAIPFETYVGLNFSAGEIINLKCYRKKRDDYEMIELKIPARPVESMKYIPKLSNYMYKYGPFTFEQLTEDMIIKLSINNFKLCRTQKKHYIDRPFRDLNKIIIIISYVETNLLNDDQIKVLERKGIPYSKDTDRCYFLATVKKINEQQINNVDDFMKLITDREIIMSIKTIQQKLIKLKFEHGDYIKLI